MMRLAAVLLLYNLLIPIAMMVMLPGAWKKMRQRGGSLRDMLQRFARYPAEVREWLAGHEKPVWIHAVSVGEVQVALKMVREFAKQKPEQAVILTTTTPTGYAIAKREMEALGGITLYSPLDVLPIALAALREIRPSAIVLTEAEVWPNLTWLAHRSGIPVFLANARMSPRSEKRMQKFRGLLEPIYDLLTSTYVQEENDIERWAGIGVPTKNVEVTGSVKYDPEGGGQPPHKDPRLPGFEKILDSVRPAPRKVVMGISTHPGEEDFIAKALANAEDDVVFVAVPRHFERAAEVAEELRALGLSPVLRSAGGEGDCLIIDTTGELKVWTELADIVVVGKSFLAKGGQNPGEAACAGKAIIAGPDMTNFTPLIGLLSRANGLVQLSDPAELESQLTKLLADDAARKELGENARAAVEVHRGATQRTVRGILALLS